MNKIVKSNISHSPSLLKSVSNVSGWTGISRIFGLIRDISTTGLLGATAFHDIFVITLKIPNMFRRFFAEGAFNQAFVPIYSDYVNEGDNDAAKKYLNAVAGFLITFLFFFTLAVLIFAPIFILVFAPGFYFDPLKKDLSILVLRIMFPYLALISLVAFAGGIQNTHEKYSIPAATPIIFNLCLIIAAIFIAPKYEIPIFVLAWGVILAGFLQLLIQYFPLATLGRMPKPTWDINNKGLKKFLVLILPAILAGGITQINLLIDTIFASLLETGSPTWLYISDRLIQLPMGIFAIAIGTILLPTLSKLDTKNEKGEFISALNKGQRFVFFISMPCFIGLFFCAEDIISAIFLRGEFLVLDVYKSSYSLMAFAIGLPFFMLMKVLTPAFFARKDTKTPMFVALISLILNAFLNYILAFVFDYGHVGIAIGSSVAALISVLILEVILIKSGYVKVNFKFNKFNLAILAGLLALLVFVYNFSNLTDFISMTQLERFLYLFVEVFTAMIIYFLTVRIFFGKSILKELN